MEADMQESSENLSEENDQSEEVNDDLSTKRSYQCAFCRRGFTNAQALGGHMNIHRKDRAKEKHISINSALANKSYEDNFSTRYMADEQTKYYSVFEAQTNYYQTYYQPSPSNPRYPPVSYSFEHNFLAATRTHGQPLNQELLGANLSLGMGHYHHVDENQMRVGVKSDGEVDLELRLGYHQY